MLQDGKIEELHSLGACSWDGAKTVKSTLKNFERIQDNSALSVKIVTEGTECYQLGHTNFNIGKNHVFIVDEGEKLSTVVNSKKVVEGICIYPPKNLIDEVYDCTLRGDSLVMDSDHSKIKPNFLNYSFKIGSQNATAQFIADKLERLTSSVNKTEQWWSDFYVELSEKLVFDQLQIEDRLGCIKASKKEVKEELYRRLLRVQNYLHDNKNEVIKIDTLVEISMLSKYHFIRCFKAVFQTTPYQYLLNLKLKEAKRLYANGFSMNEISMMIGYSDPKNLAKALRRF